MDNAWRLDIRKGWLIGLSLAVVCIAATVGLVVAALVRPLSIWVFLLAIGASLTLGLAVRILYQLWGLVNASYELDRNALVIRWGPVEHQIPMGSVREVIAGTKLQQPHTRLGLRWPGYAVALGRATIADSGDNGSAEGVTLDPVLFYAAGGPEKQVVLRTDAVAYAISPADLEAFLTALRERLEMGPTQEVEERATHPKFLDWPIWQDRWALGMLLTGFGLLILLMGIICWRYPYLPPEVVLRVTATGEPLLVTRAARIFYVVLVGAIFAVLDTALGFVFYRRERPIAYFLWSGHVAIIASLCAAVVAILLMQ
jgi:hypothetical protein